MKNFLSYIFLFFGIVLFFIFSLLFIQHYNPSRLAFTSPVTFSSQLASHNLPMAISFSSIQQTLPIFPAKITGTTWQTTTHGASYLTSSPLPGSIGNSIIYGHNWTSLLGGLTKVKPGDKISVVYQNGDIKIFKVGFTSIVTPDQTQILGPAKDARLTIYTCTGFLDSKRFVVTAFLDGTKTVAQNSFGTPLSNFIF